MCHLDSKPNWIEMFYTSGKERNTVERIHEQIVHINN